MTRLPGINAYLASAVRRVAAAYERRPAAHRPEINSQEWSALEAEINAACARGDRDSAGAAIDRWERHAMNELGQPMDVDDSEAA